VTAASQTADAPTHWVFGYGSLIWHPGFPYLRREQAVLKGAHRRLCVYSHRHRGTAERPGLVFGLMRGGSCRGMAFAVADSDWTDTREYLRRREQDADVYREAQRGVVLQGGAVVSALTFVVDEQSVQFAGRLSVEQQLDIVRAAHGESGANRDYVLKTVEHLVEMGIRDRQLLDLAERLEAVMG
jgi:glutathione-specific gamma-glutamylcyclotransferase